MNYSIKLNNLYTKLDVIDRQRSIIENQVYELRKKGLKRRMTHIMNMILLKPVSVFVTDFSIEYDKNNDCFQEFSINVYYKKNKYYLYMRRETYNNQYSCYTVSVKHGKKVTRLQDNELQDFIKNKYRLPSKKMLKMFCILALENDLIYENEEYENIENIIL